MAIVVVLGRPGQALTPPHEMTVNKNFWFSVSKNSDKQVKVISRGRLLTLC